MSIAPRGAGQKPAPLPTPQSIFSLYSATALEGAHRFGRASESTALRAASWLSAASSSARSAMSAMGSRMCEVIVSTKSAGERVCVSF